MAGYYVKQIVGKGFAVFNEKDEQVELFEGQGSKAQAEESAAKLNGTGDIADIDGDDYVRGSGREGRSA
ncbi:MAG: hypothetical protein AAB276_06925 [Pseudomonadota bacterium]